MEVLQKADVFLTHCGMNSVNEALYYGVPLVLFPQTLEQGAVAIRTNEVGAGAYLKEDSVECIKSTILSVMQDATYRQSAQKVADGFRACGGSKLAADKIEALSK